MIKSHSETVLYSQTQFQKFLQDISQENHQAWILTAMKTLHIKSFGLQKLSLKKYSQMYDSIVKKFYNLQKYRQDWLQNELRIFIFLLVCYAKKIQIEPAKFKNQNWEFFNKFLMGKNIQIFQFQYNALKIRPKFEKWVEEEDQLLLSIIHLHKQNAWNNISRDFFIKSEKKFFRSPKQCRERWNNYLDPEKYRGGQWSLVEDYELIKFILNRGKRWSILSRQLEIKRTEHMVKNRYKSLLTKEKKKEKIKNSLGEIRILQRLLLKLQYQISLRKEQKIQVPSSQKNTNSTINQRKKPPKIPIMDDQHSQIDMNQFQQYANQPNQQNQVDNELNQQSVNQISIPIIEQVQQIILQNELQKNEIYYSTNDLNNNNNFQEQLINYEYYEQNQQVSLFDLMIDLQ